MRIPCLRGGLHCLIHWRRGAPRPLGAILVVRGRRVTFPGYHVCPRTRGASHPVEDSAGRHPPLLAYHSKRILRVTVFPRVWGTWFYDSATVRHWPLSQAPAWGRDLPEALWKQFPAYASVLLYRTHNPKNRLFSFSFRREMRPNSPAFVARSAWWN